MAGSHLRALVGALLVCVVALVPATTHAARTTATRNPTISKPQLTPDAQQDHVDYLPGWGPINDFGLYAGYVTVDPNRGRHLFYTFAEALESPDTKPLLLWLNGGPGCSSVGGGFMSELGPFLPKPGGKALQRNPYSWNRIANVLFVESPAFVGFSYSETPSDAVVGDERTAQDMRSFLIGFLKRFPQLADRDLYISGESYAGHYLPTLAWTIIQGNEKAKAAARTGAGSAQDPATQPEGYLNFKGIALGNPWTDAAVDNLGAVDFWWAHALISDQTALGIKNNCDFARIGPLDTHPADADIHTRAGACDKFCNTAMYELGAINIYHIFADLCQDPGTARVTRALAAALAPTPATTQKQAAKSSHPLSTLLGAAAVAKSEHQQKLLLSQGSTTAAKRRGQDNPDDDDGTPEYDPCTDDEVFTYLNLPEVQKALHANVSGHLPGPWEDCTRKISYSRADLLTSMLPIWQKLVETPGLRFLVYSGDVDGIVPVVGTRRWVAALGLPEVRPWRPWISGVTQQVGGWTVEYSTRHGRRRTADVASSATTTTTQESADPASGAPVHSVDVPLRGDFVFATVRFAGHMVPYVQPQRALHMISRFLEGEAL